MKKGLVAAACLLAIACFSNGAKAASKYSIYVTNDTDYGVWVTTYVSTNTRRSIIKAECVRPHQKASVPSQSNDVGGWTLFEIKQDKSNCNGANMMVVERNVKVQAAIVNTSTNSIRVNSQ